jgi:transcriptional regulator with XRE-family HTH domain
MIIGKRIKELRISKKLSQRKLASVIGVSQAIFVKWENEEHEPKATYIVELAKYFNVTTDYLLGLENEDYTKNYAPPARKDKKYPKSNRFNYCSFSFNT